MQVSNREVINMQKKEVAGDYVGNNNNEESKPDGS